jgi:ketosteroid isomerase-like protein
VSSEKNSALVRRYFADCVNGAGGPNAQRALALVDELLNADFVMFYNNQTDAEATRGRERHKEFLTRHARSYRDDQWTVEGLVADEETVACRWRIQATHAETGNRIDLRAADFFVVRSGRLSELRRFLDFDALNQQKRPAQRG